MAFEDIIGNEDAKQYFNKALKEGHLAHSYIFEGPYGVGKRTFAKELAKQILCNDKTNGNACNQCQSCHMIESGTHPDMIVVKKDTKIIKVDTIREKIVREMDIKPYQSDYKIVIVESADSMNVQGQNALLKTIEEPPAYGIIILLAENMDMLLPTIKSRCISVRINPLSDNEIKNYFSSSNISEDEWNIYAKLADGSIGAIKRILSDENFLSIREQSADYIIRLDKANLIELYNIVEEVAEQKENIDMILTFWLQWYRDLAILKAIQRKDIYFSDYYAQLLDMSTKLTYNKISYNISYLKQGILDLKNNVYNLFIIENLLLKLKERGK